MSLANIGDELGLAIRIRQCIELMVNGGAAVSIDSVTQLISEADADFDTDATSTRMHPTVIGFLNNLRNVLQGQLAQADRMAYAILKNRAWADVKSTAAENDIRGFAGDFTKYLRDQTKTVLECTPAIGAATAGGNNTGTGVPKLDMLDTWNRNNQAIQNEDFEIACTSDAVTGSTNQHQETFMCQGSFGGKLSGIKACMYPAGDGSGNSGGGNRLQNEDASTPGNGDNADVVIPFEHFTTNTPDGWTIDTGAAGTDVLDGANGLAQSHFGSTCMEFVGDGATLIEVSQDAHDFYGATAGGTTTAEQDLEPLAHYIIGCYMKAEAGITAGVVSFYLDATGYTAGATEMATKDMSGTPPTAAFTLYTGIVKMPKGIPSDMKAVFKCTTALSNTHSVSIDGAFLAKMYFWEAKGFNIAMVPSPTAFVYDERDPDRFYWTTTNDWAGLFQEWFARRTDTRDITRMKYNDIGMAVRAGAAASAELAETKAQ